MFNRAQEVAIGVLKLVNKAVGSSKEVVEQNKEKLVLRRERLCDGEEKGWEQRESS